MDERKVYPACAGIHLCANGASVPVQCLPRMRGDPPLQNHEFNQKMQSTPHARGSTAIARRNADGSNVYPACAGIHLTVSRARQPSAGLPRMRGDPPLMQCLKQHLILSTPHARGSTA